MSLPDGTIYMDHAATTPTHPAVIARMLPYFGELFGNPSSVYTLGRRSMEALDSAHETVATLLNCRPTEIVFTGGGSEADNLAIKGIAYATRRRGNHIITTAIEHHAVLHTCQQLEREGYTVTYLPVDSTGMVDPAAVEAALTDQTALVTMMYVNNEVGTIQPIAELSRIAREGGALFHTDAVQSAGKIRVDVREMDVDLASFSAHKLYGPKGVGALWIRRGVRLMPVLTGGRQERNRRPGTENVAGIVGFGVAARLAAARLEAEATRLAALRDRLEAAVLERVPQSEVNGARDARVPNTANISFAGVEAESLLIALDLEGIAVSTGSACSSGTLEPSHVLKAMGLPGHRAQSSIRFSLGLSNTERDVDRLVEVLPGIVERLRAVMPTSK